MPALEESRSVRLPRFGLRQARWIWRLRSVPRASGACCGNVRRAHLVLSSCLESPVWAALRRYLAFTGTTLACSTRCFVARSLAALLAAARLSNVPR